MCGGQSTTLGVILHELSALFFFFFKLFLEGLVGEEDPHVQPGLSALVWEESTRACPGPQLYFSEQI